MRLRRLTRVVAIGAAAAAILTLTAGQAQAYTDTTQIQWDVAGLGYLGFSGVDGSYGPATTAAVRSYQSDHSSCLAVDGDAGPNTTTVLSDEVRQVQAKVGTTVDGAFGPNTEAAVKSYQSAHGLGADGQAGPATRQAMGLAATAGCSALGTPAPPPSDPTPPTGSGVRSSIVSIARGELGNSAHNHEIGGYNCNYYSTQLGVGTTGSCSNGWRSEEWCADFALWVWSHAGADTSGLDAGAVSFYRYGQHFGTWHSGLSGVQVGDAVVFDVSGNSASHVGLVVSTSGGVVMISGNSGSPSDSVTQANVASASGYSEPVS